MRKSRLFMSAAAACLAGTMAVTGFAATEHWNDNSGKKAISDEWSQWKTKWETIKTDYEKVSMVPHSLVILLFLFHFSYTYINFL